jgi:hypothetical protein
MSGCGSGRRAYEFELREARARSSQCTSRRALEIELRIKVASRSAPSEMLDTAASNEARLDVDAIRKTIKLLRLEERRLLREVQALRMLLAAG